MTIQIGDPNHLGIHNDLVAATRQAAQRAGVDVTLPDTAHLGDTGHVADHNLLALALAEIAAKGGGMTWAKVTGGTVTTVSNADGSVDEIHTFTADGTLTVESPGYARVLLVGSGGGGSSPYAGYGGDIVHGIHPLPAGALPVVVGQPGATQTVGGASSLGSLLTAVAATAPSSGRAIGGGGTIAAPNEGFTSSISGTALVYSKANQSSPRANFGDGRNDGATLEGSSGVVIVRVQQTPPTSVGVACTGGTETTYTGDGSNGVLGQRYRVHTFTANGTLTVAQTGLCDVLIVSGGSGGQAGNQGGLGAAILLPSIVLGAGNLPVVIGRGGNAGVHSQAHGWPSSLGTLTSPTPSFTWDAGFKPPGITTAIDGVTREYARPAIDAPRVNSGDGGNGNVAGAAGVIVVRYAIV